MKKYILLFINLFIIVNSFNYSLDDFDIVSTPVNDYKIPYSSINEIDFNLPNVFIYNLVDFLI